MIGWLASLVLAPLILLWLGASWAGRLAVGLVTGRWIRTLASASILGLVFLMTTGVSAGDALLGLAVGLLLALMSPVARGRPDLRKLPARVMRVFPLVWAMLREVERGIALNTRVLLGLSSPEKAGVIELPLEDRTEAGTTLTGLLVTAAPGTMMVCVERRRMLVHALDASDPEAVRSSLQDLYRRYQRPVLP